MINYYKVLGVTDFASLDEIKTAYRKLAKKFHPDMNQGDKFSEERFIQIQSAYEALCDNAKRKKLDEILRESESKKNYQKQESTKSKETYKEQQTKSDNNTNNSQTKNSETKKENTNEQTKNFIPKKTINNSLIFGAIGLLVFYIFYSITSNKNNKKSVINISDYLSKDSYNPPTQKENNYQPKATLETNNNYSDEVSSSISKDNFTIGSSKQEVLKIQGNPSRTVKLDELNKDIWHYDFSSITFIDGKVTEYSNNSNNLRVQYSESISNNHTQTEDHNYNLNFSIGSSKQEVLKIQGKPTRTVKLDDLNKDIWHYDFSSVTFINGKVSEYSDNSKNLKVKY
jgi:curved DNA-binding protein CbpA